MSDHGQPNLTILRRQVGEVPDFDVSIGNQQLLNYILQKYQSEKHEVAKSVAWGEESKIAISDQAIQKTTEKCLGMRVLLLCSVVRDHQTKQRFTILVGKVEELILEFFNKHKNFKESEFEEDIQVTAILISLELIDGYTELSYALRLITDARGSKDIIQFKDIANNGEES